MNSIRLSKADIFRFIAQMVPSERTTQYLCLSMSIANMLTETYPSNAHVVRAFLQLLEEYEYYFAGATVQSMKYLLAKNSPTLYPVAASAAAFVSTTGGTTTVPPPHSGSIPIGDRPSTTPTTLAGTDDDPPPTDAPDTNHNSTTATPTVSPTPASKSRHGGPSIHKFDSTIVYEHLVTSHVPFELDHVEVFVSLCEVLTALYDRFPHEECYSSGAIYDSIMKIDSRMKKYVVELVAKELTEFSTGVLKSEAESLR